MRQEGKEPFRITPYYASLMQEDPFNPVFFGEVSKKRWKQPGNISRI